MTKPASPAGLGTAARQGAGSLPAWGGLISVPLLIVIWQIAAVVIASRFLPSPLMVADTILRQATEGHLVADFAKTLGRAAAGFVIAMTLGTVLGLILGRSRLADGLFGSWVVVGMNMPAIVIAIVCYIWLGLSDLALILAVVLNKTPLVITTIREGVRSFQPEFDEFARAFRLPLGRRLRLIYAPQLLPFLLAAARTGLSLIWKIVLVFEVLGSDGGVGFRVSIFYQFFDMKGILGYTTVFIVVIMALEHGLLRPLERKVLAWRPARP